MRQRARGVYGEVYNELVDVFSFAMCMVELVSQKLPWSGVALGAEVPHRVTQNLRPLKQLQGCNPTLKDLIKRCWNGRPNERPTFTNIVLELKVMLGEGQQSRPPSPQRSRPASPELRGAE